VLTDEVAQVNALFRVDEQKGDVRISLGAFAVMRWAISMKFMNDLGTDVPRHLWAAWSGLGPEVG
jgi:hypothetical protein